MKWILALHKLLWGLPMILLILGVGIFLSLLTRFVQLRSFVTGVRSIVRPGKGGSFSPRQSLCVTLAATVGTGNLVGVAGGICLGGPGAVFWMWVCGFFGMAVKFAEAVLSVRYRTSGKDGWLGGPMYTISRGLPSGFRFLSVLYCVFGLIASFGVGNAVQVQSILSGIHSILHPLDLRVSTVFDFAAGIVLASILGLVLFGGFHRIGSAAEGIIPGVVGLYILMCAVVLAKNAHRIPDAFTAVLQGACSPRSVTGGVIGSAFQALRAGCARGVFSNEAGMGTAAMAYSSVDSQDSIQIGAVGVLEVFLDTIVICTLSSLVILTSGVPIPYGIDSGGTLIVQSFSQILGGLGGILIGAVLCAVAFATILGWGLYGARCCQFLFGEESWFFYSALHIGVIVISSVMPASGVWLFAETANGLLALPNLLSLVLLSPELQRIIQKQNGIYADGGTYANLDQCKPM